VAQRRCDNWSDGNRDIFRDREGGHRHSVNNEMVETSQIGKERFKTLMKRWGKSAGSVSKYM
jgi:hypothetical protein